MSLSASSRRSRRYDVPYDSIDLGSLYSLYRNGPTASEEASETTSCHAFSSSTDHETHIEASASASSTSFSDPLRRLSSFPTTLSLTDSDITSLPTPNQQSRSPTTTTSTVSLLHQEQLQDYPQGHLHSFARSYSLEQHAKITSASLCPSARLSPTPYLTAPTAPPLPRPQSRLEICPQGVQGIRSTAVETAGPVWAKYTTVMAGFLACTCSFGFQNSIGIFQTHYEARYPARSVSEIAWIGASQTFFLLFGNLIGGPLMDRIGPRPVLTTSALLIASASVATAFTTHYWQTLITQGIFLGISASLAFAAPVACIMQWFDRKRATWVGVALSGAPIGGIVWPILVKSLLESHGFRIMWLVVASLQLVMMGAASLLVRPRFSRARRQPRIASSALGAQLAPAKSALPPPPPPACHVRPLFHLAAFRCPAYSLSVVGQFFIWLAIYYLFFYLPDWGKAFGLSSSLQTYVLSMLGAAALLGRLLLPMLADLVGAYEVMILSTLSSSAILLCSIPAHRPQSILFVGALYGFSSGGINSLQAPVLAEAIDDPEVFGAVLGQSMAMLSPAALIGAPLDGLILRDKRGGYACAQVFAGFSMAIGGILLIFARFTLNRKFFAVS